MSTKTKPRTRVKASSYAPRGEDPTPTEIKTYAASRTKHADGTVDREFTSIDLRRHGMEVAFYLTLPHLEELRAKIDEMIETAKRVELCTRSVCYHCNRNGGAS